MSVQGHGAALAARKRFRGGRSRGSGPWETPRESQTWAACGNVRRGLAPCRQARLI